jgi:hypothetical protein
VGVDRVVRQRVTAHGAQDPPAVLGDHFDVTVEQHPVARERPVAVPELMPAVVGLRVLLDRNDAQ